MAVKIMDMASDAQREWTDTYLSVKHILGPQKSTKDFSVSDIMEEVMSFQCPWVVRMHARGGIVVASCYLRYRTRQSKYYFGQTR